MLFRQLKNVFAKPKYLVLAVLIAGVMFTLSLWIPNFRLIGVVLSSDTAQIQEKISFLLSLYASIGTNFTVVSASYTILIAVLFGINIALLTYYIYKVRGNAKGAKAVGTVGVVGVGGLVSGVFGIGCAACGTFILTSVLAVFGATGLLAFLPFGGAEFGFLGVGLLMYSTYMLTKKIEKPITCDIK